MTNINHWREIDFRGDWVSVVFSALESGFNEIQEMAKELDWFDAGFQLEHAESIFSIVFITAQTYIVGVVEDINKICESNGKAKLNKIDCYNDDSSPLGSRISRILLINAVANYCKHHDEWGKTWNRNLTVNTLSAVGITENTEFPCYEAAAKLFGDDKMWNFENLLVLISNWRKYILSKYI